MVYRRKTVPPPHRTPFGGFLSYFVLRRSTHHEYWGVHEYSFCNNVRMFSWFICSNDPYIYSSRTKGDRTPALLKESLGIYDALVSSTLIVNIPYIGVQEIAVETRLGKFVLNMKSHSNNTRKSGKWPENHNEKNQSPFMKALVWIISVKTPQVKCTWPRESTKNGRASEFLHLGIFFTNITPQIGVRMARWRYREARRPNSKCTLQIFSPCFGVGDIVRTTMSWKSTLAQLFFSL